MINSNAMDFQKVEVILDSVSRPKLDVKMCQMVKLHIDNFYDIIGIRWERLKFNDWILEEVLSMESLVFLLQTNKFFLKDETTNLMTSIYNKYFQSINMVFNPKSLLAKFMRTWTKITSNGILRKDLSKKNGYVQNVLKEEDYWFFNPIYVVDIVYKEAFDLYGKTSPKSLRRMVNLRLKSESEEIEYLIEIFKQNYDDLLEDFLCLAPEEKHNFNFYDKLMFLQLTFTEVLLDKNVYAAHAIIESVIGSQLFDFESEENTNKIFCYV
jgi:hypothetical protein